MLEDMAGNMVFAGEAERTWLQELASAWSVRLCFRKSLGADMFARITISSDGDAWVEMLEGFDPEEYYRRWGNRDIEPPELFRFLLLHEIAHRELGHERQRVLPGIRTRQDWQDAIKNREDETDQWARERLRNPWPNPAGTGRCLVGCSGWSYDSWKGIYYPEGLKSIEWLPHYAKYFPTTEINMSFYRLPNEKIILSWAKRVHPRFVFAAKGSRRITHYKRLENCSEETERFLRRMALLPQLCCILWQLPPSLENDPSLLDNFCRLLPGHRRQAVEFRHPSWWENLDETAEILSRYRIAFTGVSRKGLPCYAPLTADFSYFRFHGLGESPYQWSYTREELKPWVKRIKDLSERGVDVYAYFNNDADARAVENARDLAEMVAETP